MLSFPAYTIDTTSSHTIEFDSTLKKLDKDVLYISSSPNLARGLAPLIDAPNQKTAFRI